MNSPAPNAQPPSLEEKLAQAQEQEARWAKLAQNPELSLRAQLQARENARSYQAATVLAGKALEYRKQSESRLNRPLGPSPEILNSPSILGPDSTE